MDNQGKKPNFLLIVVDDMGYSDCEPFGGEIRTPNIMRLAEEGVRFRHFYTSSLCAPTRSLLMTGVDNHLNGLGVMPPMHSMNQFMKPGYEGTLNGKVATIAELLGDAWLLYVHGGQMASRQERRPAAGGPRFSARVQLPGGWRIPLLGRKGARASRTAAHAL